MSETRCYANNDSVLSCALGKKRMKRGSDWLFLRFALVALVLAVANAFEAAYIDNPDGVWHVVSWLFAAAAALGFLVFLAIAISERFLKD